jgi:hypothetical protein
MGFECTRPGYSVSVHGLLLGGIQFVIHAAIEYDPLLPDGERERLAPLARLETLLAIEGQEERARRLGARDVRVGVVGDMALRRFYKTPSTPAALPVRTGIAMPTKVKAPLHA